MPSALQPPPLTPAASVQPCAQAFNVAVATAQQGAAWVMVTFYGPCGSWSCFLDPDAAENLAAQLGENITLSRSGLVVARGPLPPGPLNGHGPTIEHRP